MIRTLMMLFALLLAGAAAAHKPSDAYLTVERNGSVLQGQWDIALRDLDNAIGLDANGDGEITWRELKARHAEIAAYALGRLRIASAGETCPLSVGDQLVDSHTDGSYAVLKFTATCPQPGPTLTIDYRLFRDVDPQHRGLLNFVESGESRSVVFSEETPVRVVGGDAGGPLVQFATYVHEGIWHIWLGLTTSCFCSRCCCLRC